MEKYKKLRLSLITLLLALVVALTAAVFAINSRGIAADAATDRKDRFVELDGNSVFYTAIHGAEISESQEVSTGDGETAETHRYTLFKIGSEETVAYRQNLAYKWIRNKTDADGNYLNIREDKYFSMELYFPKIDFERYYIKFESQQYTLTEDGKSTNYIVFTPNADKTAVQVAVAQSDKDGKIGKTENVGTPIANNTHIEITIDNYDAGNYDLIVNNVTSSSAFKNVNKYFASYVASGDNAVTPLTFGAEFEEGKAVETENGAQMVLVDISGQSFEMYKDDSVYKIKDTAAPVLCFSQTPSYLEYGKTIGFQYKVIDVLANITSNSSRATAYYYVLTGKQVEDVNFEYDRIDYETETTDSEGEGEEVEKQTSPFKKVTSTSSERIYSNENTFIPEKYLKSDVMGLVKIYYEISDYATASMAFTDKVFVDWYVEEALGANSYTALEEVDIYNSGKLGGKFLKLIKGKEGATYASFGDDEDADPLKAYKKSVSDFQKDYQEKIDEAIGNLEDGKLYAGGKKFYLPAIEWDFLDDYLTGTDYKYSLYYRGATSGSSTSLASDKLAIDLNDADTTYRFTIFITDAFGNPMRYPDLDDDNKVVWKEITTSDVWDEDFADLLPYFEFDVSYKEATAEPPKNLSISYVKSNYSGVSFTITGVSGTYTAKYKLYVFDRNKYYADTKDDTLDYDTFAAKVQEIFDNPQTRKYFTTVKPVSELLESDKNYDKFKALNWNASSVTFTPQSVEDFYVIELQLTDNRSQNAEAYYATVASSVQTKSLKGESDWLEYNKTSIVLFAVAGACLVALIILLVIKPKDKGDIDTIYSEVEAKDKDGGKKRKTEKNKK